MDKDNFDSLGNISGSIKWAIVALVAFVQSVPELTWLLVGLMVLDTAFAFWVAVQQHDVSPTAMWKGVSRKLGQLGVIVLAAILDRIVVVMGIHIAINLMQIANAAYIWTEALSVFRNAALAGVPIPPQFAQVLRVLQPPNQEPKPIENRALLKDS